MNNQEPKIPNPEKIAETLKKLVVLVGKWN